MEQQSDVIMISIEVFKPKDQELTGKRNATLAPFVFNRFDFGTYWIDTEFGIINFYVLGYLYVTPTTEDTIELFNSLLEFKYKPRIATYNIDN